MRVRVSGVLVALAMVLGLSWDVKAEVYVWTDERGVVHMTDRWANVPESMRTRVAVRESSPAPRDTPPAPGQADPAMPPIEPRTAKPSPSPMPPDLPEMPPPAAPPPSVAPYAPDTAVLVPGYRPFVHPPKKLSPPFPYNVRLDPFDQNFVWVGPNRVPKNTFTYPRVSLDQQAKFRDRLRVLEQRRSGPPKQFPAPMRPR